MKLLNQFSYLIAAVLVLLVIGSWTLERRTLRSLGVLALSAALLVTANVVFRPGASTVAAAAEFDRLLQDGRPTLAAFHSNY